MKKIIFTVVVISGTWALMGPMAQASFRHPFRRFFERPLPVKPKPPQEIKPSVTLGAKLYVRACESCHGPRGNGEAFWLLPPGDKAPALDHLEAQEKNSRFLTQVITQGKGMMPEWGQVLNPVEIRSLVKYLLSVNNR